MLSKLETYLTEKNVFNHKTPNVITALVETIPTNIPYKMKLILVISEIITFISQFRINIKHWNNSSIPINAITFLIAESGASKDSTLKTVRKSFKSSYDIINNKRKEEAKRIAIQKATDLGMENPTNFHTYSEFYTAPNPLFVAPSTTEGFIQHLNDIDKLGIGAGYLSTSELGAELSNNANLVDNIKLIAELYDEGIKDVKVLKDRSNQSKEIRGLPVSALFMGSQDNILFDEAIKRKFKTEFTTKLARRSFFVYISEKIEKTQYNNITDFLSYIKSIENSALEKQNELSDHLKILTYNLIDNIGSHITIDEDTRDLITIYKEYNELLAETIDNLSSMTKLSRQHMHWKALKLAGALALIRNKFTIDIDTYSYAITFVENIFKDITLFEQELTKESYEVFVSYVHNYCTNNELFLSIHDLKKKKFISNKGDLNKKIEELVTLASIYDKNGLYKQTKEGILFEQLETSDSIGVSIIESIGTKQQRISTCEKGYIYLEGKQFEKLANILKGDYAYSPFKFNNGIRGKDNIISGTKWIALDVDKSTFTDHEIHLMLEDLKHIIVRTSNSGNPYKFRILLELDNIINIPSNNWSRLLESIANELAIEIDILPQSQIFFSYKESADSILTNFDGELFTIKPHIEYALNKEIKPIVHNISDLQNPYETFSYAFQAKQGEGSRMMYKAAKHAKDLGATKEQILDLVNKINNYWIVPMSKDRFENTIIKQIERWSF